MKAKTITKKIMLIVTLITTVITTAVVLLIGSGYSWFTDTRTTKVKINSSVLGSYFQSGSGTEEDPYEVHLPIQLYYLAWLQDLGAFNTTYTENGVTHINQYYFYLSDDLDMSEYTLPPIGTAKYPFVGNFTGQDKEGTYHKISNLTVSNIEALTDVPYTQDPNIQLNSYQIVGFFGIIGSVDGVTDNTYDTTGETPTLTSLGSVTIGDNTYTYNSEANEVKNFLLDTCTIESKIPTDNKTLVGIAAGYVAGYMSGVGVYNSSIDLAQNLVILDGENMSEKLSGYALVGYSQRAIDEYAAANAAGEGEGWGGSIDMMALHNRLQNVLGDASNSATYVSREAHYINTVTGEDRTETLSTSTMGSYGTGNNKATFKYYQSDLGGSFVFADDSNTGEYYDLFHGQSATYWPKTVVTYTYSGTPENGYIFTNGSKYLKAINNAVSAVDDEKDATIFVLDNNGKLNYKYDNPTQNTTTVTTYYLSVNTSLAFTFGTTANSATAWTISNGEAYVTVSGNQYSLGYYNNAWSFRKRNYAVIKDGDNFLKITTSSSSAVSTEEDATKWYFAGDDNASGKIYTVIDGTFYYLNHNGSTLSITSTSGSSKDWTWDTTNNALKTTYNNKTYGVEFNGTSWIIKNDPCYLITDGTRYINASNGSIGYTNTQSSATKWAFSNGSSGGIISAKINGTIHYLYNDNGSLTISTTQQTEWAISNNTIYSGDYYIEYNNTWKLTKASSFYITDESGHYLRVTGTGRTNFGNTTKANASKWQINDSGKLYTTYNNNYTCYLYFYSNTAPLGVTTNSNTATGTWSFDEETGALSHTNNNQTRFLRVEGTTWTLKKYYSLYDETKGIYLIPNGTSSLTTTSNRNDSYKWLMDGNYYYVLNGTTAYYLNRPNSSPYAPRISNSTQRRFTLNGNNKLVANNYYIYRNGNSWSSVNSESSGDTFRLFEEEYPSTPLILEPAFDSNKSYSQEDSFLKAITRLTRNGTGDLVAVSKQRYNYTKTVQQNQKGGYDTYFPLAASSTSTYDVIQAKNTGYIVGGSHASQQAQWGDVRVSSFYKIYGTYNYQTQRYLSSSLSGLNAYDGKKLEVLTQTYLSDGLKRVSDTYNENNTTISDLVSDYAKTSITDLGLQKYASSREQFEDTYTKDGYDGVSLYGLHFMDAEININNLITAPTVYINNDPYYNYQMPEDSICFRLKSKGYINFFAGTYYLPSDGNSNNSFFSLYEIVRNANSEIIDIKHIIKVWGNPNDEFADYIYQYEGEDDPTDLDDGYVMMFDCKWIEEPTMVERALYYFEVPANRGEYALGSVKNRYGAYLLYLDISANGGDVENEAFDYLTGVDFVSSNDSANLSTMLTSIGNNNPTAIFNISYAMVSSEAQKVTFARSADTTVNGKVQSHFTITGSTTNQQANVKYYFVPADDKERPEFIYLPSSG